ncbi:hypothetical protein FRC08_007724 [Ceratobasidium sp. 394]|nr:hypothetical protein FRC08_007724 [Ceratobasidium sp. 394]
MLINLQSYAEAPFFPITTTQIVPFQVSNTSTATGTVTPIFRPRFAAFRDEGLFHSLVGDSGFETCDYIEDYRTSTIFSALGPIGGLFALLQSFHAFLFGRPILWGLTGAKLISPFEFFGLFTSKGFKRRLRENYYSAPLEGAEETFRVDAFLNDFVIDFGPAFMDKSTADGDNAGIARQQPDVEASTTVADHPSATAEV